MTVSKEYNKHIYEGNGLTVDWPYDFDLPITAAGAPDTSLIHVFRTNLRGEVTEVTAFSVDAETGTLTYPTSGSPLETGEKLTILRLLDVRQQFFDPSNQANLYPETLEDNTDRLVMMIQQIDEEVGRAVTMGEGYEGEEVTAEGLLEARDIAISAAETAEGYAAQLPAIADELGVNLVMDEADLRAKITVIGASDATLVIATSIPLAEDLTIPSNIALAFKNTGSLEPAVTKTLTVNGPIDAGLWQIFDGDGTVTGSPKIEKAYPEWFGAVTDGASNCASALNKALSFCKYVQLSEGVYYVGGSSFAIQQDYQTLAGKGTSSVIKHDSGSTVISVSSKKEICLRDFKIDGDGTVGGIRITNGSSKITIQNLFFSYGDQRVWLFTCDNILVDGCTFESTGYGIIQQVGYVSNYVIVTNCFAHDMRGDFVECNCTSNAPSVGWTVTNNTYTGGHGWPTDARERRFVGSTAVSDFVISNNIIHKSCGDAAIHLEDIGGNVVIANNIFDNCIQQSQQGYIFLLSSHAHTIIQGNIFKRTDTSLPNAYGISVSGNVYTNDVIIANNRFIGNGPEGNFSGVDASFQSYMLCSNNVFNSLKIGILIADTLHSTFSGNRFLSCNSSFAYIRGSASFAGSDVLVCNNVTTGTVDSYDLCMVQNTKGTNPPLRWTVTNNVFSKSVKFTHNPGGIPCKNIVVVNNVHAEGTTISVDLAGSHGNVVENNYTRVA